MIRKSSRLLHALIILIASRSSLCILLKRRISLGGNFGRKRRSRSDYVRVRLHRRRILLFPAKSCLDITSLGDFMAPVRRVRRCANQTTIRYIPMQSTGGLATRLLTNELNFSLSPCFVPFLRHRPSPFLARTLLHARFHAAFFFFSPAAAAAIKRRRPRPLLAQEILFRLFENKTIN